MKRDTAIFDIIARERQRQLKGIELIASENFVSDQVMEAMGSPKVIPANAITAAARWWMRANNSPSTA